MNIKPLKKWLNIKEGVKMSKYRTELDELTDERRYSFRGIFTYTGYKNTGRFSDKYGILYSPTFMLKNVEYWNEENNTWEFVAEHLWLNYTKQFKYYFPLLKDDIIYFNGRIKKYSYKDGINVRINIPTKVKVERNGDIIDKTGTEVLEDWELVEVIDNENREYYAARDTIDSLYYLKNYFFVRNNIGDVEVLLNLDNKWISKYEYKNTYQDREDIIELHKRNPNPKSKIVIYEQGKDNPFGREPNSDGSIEVTPSEIQKVYNKYQTEYEEYEDFDCWDW